MLPVRTPLDKWDVHVVICQFRGVVAECLLHAVSTDGRGACDTLTKVGENRTGCRRFQTSKMARTGDVQTLEIWKNIHVSKEKLVILLSKYRMKFEECLLSFPFVIFRLWLHYAILLLMSYFAIFHTQMDLKRFTSTRYCISAWQPQK